MRGNTVMKGYLKNLAGDGGDARRRLVPVRRSCRLASDGAAEIKDRSKDIIISGGENISSLEVEEALTQHPAVMAAGRRGPARPDSGAKRPARSWSQSRSGPGSGGQAEIVASAARAAPGSRCRNRSCSGPCREHPPAKIEKFLLRGKRRRRSEPKRCLRRRPDGPARISTCSGWARARIVGPPTVDCSVRTGGQPQSALCWQGHSCRAIPKPWRSPATPPRTITGRCCALLFITQPGSGRAGPRPAHPQSSAGEGRARRQGLLRCL